MRLDDRRVVITSAGRDFGRSLAIELAERGAEVYLSAREARDAERTRDEIRARGDAHVESFVCNLSDPGSIRDFARKVAERTGHVDILINNGARYLAGKDLLSVSDEDVADTIAATATGTILAVKNFLPLLKRSRQPDIVTMVSTAGVPGDHVSDANPAFYAAKHAQAGFSQVLSHRLRPDGIRVMALYPPDFDNPDRLSPEWHTTGRTSHDALKAQSLVDCVLFAVGQPRDCFLSALHFETRR